MRTKRGRHFWLISLVTVFALQGLIMWVVALPLQTSHSLPPKSNWLVGSGILLWTFGLICESVADWQLTAFRKHPTNQGRVLRTGLWRYSRHPNYFGDFCVWWGLFLTALGCGAPWYSVVGPVLMSILLLRVSGVTLLEKTLEKRKSGYAKYQAQTSAFIPLPPRQL